MDLLSPHGIFHMELSIFRVDSWAIIFLKTYFDHSGITEEIKGNFISLLSAAILNLDVFLYAGRTQNECLPGITIIVLK